MKLKSMKKCFTILESSSLKWLLKAIFTGSLLFSVFSCDYFDKELLATVEDHKLYESDFENYVNAFDLNPNDEVTRQEFIDEWIKATIINLELSKKHPEIYYQNKFKNEESLAARNLFELENILIAEELDETVDEAEILTYYENNRNNYLQKSYIVKAMYIKVPDSIKESSVLEASFLLKNDKDREQINKYGNLYGINFYWEEDKWIFLEDLVRDIPIIQENKDEIVRNRGNGVFRDEQYVYLLNVLDYKLKETSAPLDFERENIKKHILKRRINAIREEKSNLILQEVYENYSIHHY